MELTNVDRGSVAFRFETHKNPREPRHKGGNSGETENGRGEWREREKEREEATNGTTESYGSDASRSRRYKLGTTGVGRFGNGL